MKRKAAPVFFALSVILISIIIMILPSFFSKGLSRIELKQDLDLELVLDTEREIEFVFFGYAGCVNICTPRLAALGKWYGTLPKETQERIGLKFFDLSMPEDKSLPAAFAHAFHEKFTGVFLDESILRIYSRAFNVYFSPSLLNDKEVDHTTHLYLTKRDQKGKKLRFIYTAYPYDFEQIHSDIKELSHE